MKARRLVLLIDVSGSMAAYSDALLRFAHVIAHAMPVEVRTIGTRLTRVTRQLKERDPERALRAAGRAIPDYEGGTRLGEALRRFNQQWRQRGEVVVPGIQPALVRWMEEGRCFRGFDQGQRLGRGRRGHAVRRIDPEPLR